MNAVIYGITIVVVCVGILYLFVSSFGLKTDEASKLRLIWFAFCYAFLALSFAGTLCLFSYSGMYPVVSTHAGGAGFICLLVCIGEAVLISMNIKDYKKIMTKQRVQNSVPLVIEKVV